jgi:hypothetical protein
MSKARSGTLGAIAIVLTQRALIDPATGAAAPFAATGAWKRPLVRPTP